MCSMHFGGWNLSEISERIVYLEARARVRMAEWLELVAEFDRRNAAHRRGFRGTAEWLAFECRLDRRTARDYVRVARRLQDLPRVAEAFGEGRLSYSQVRAVTRAEVVEDESALLRVAETSTAHQLEQHVRQLRSAPSADLDVAERAHARRFVTTFWDQRDGSLKFFGSLPSDAGAALTEALEERAGQIHGEDGLGARRADALVDLVTGAGVEAHVVLHADPAALACLAGPGDPRAGEVLYLRDGPAIPSALARRLTCDCTISVKDLDLGRTARVISPAQRRALEARDGRVCAMPGCDRTHGLRGHHLVHWAHGGQTDLANLALFCPFHHRLLHEEGWSARRAADGSLRILDPRGREVPRLPSRASPLQLVAA